MPIFFISHLWVLYYYFTVVRHSRKVTSVGVIALGCPKNQVDAEVILANLVQSGLAISPDPDRADVLLIHTCGFIRPAIQESLAAIRRALRQKGLGNASKVVVSGCLVQRMGEQLLDHVKGVDALVGLDQNQQIPATIKALFKTGRTCVHLGRPCSKPPIPEDSVRLLIGQGHSAYLRITEGCSHRCSFCTIPFIRGPYRSKPMDQVIQEARRLADLGVVELNIIGQDITAYLKDQGIRSALARLIQRLDRISGIRWIRLMYLYPAGITAQLIDAIASSQKVVHYLDIPIQHADTAILRAMQRPDTYTSLRSLIQRLRQRIPDVVLRTTVIVGFPGETEARFQRLLRFIRWAKFDALGCFPFYPEPGTLAASMPGQVPDEVKAYRVHQVMAAQQAIAFKKQRAMIGAVLTCLIDQQRTHNSRIARYYGQAPQIDGVCIIRHCTADPGQFVKARVLDTKGYDLIVEPVKASQ